jgi:hypothetical protein
LFDNETACLRLRDKENPRGNVTVLDGLGTGGAFTFPAIDVMFDQRIGSRQQFVVVRVLLDH